MKIINEAEAKKMFWDIYDKYILTEDKSLRSKLSYLLKEIEKEDKVNQLLRPQKGWNKILAWQVLREQEFVYDSSVSFLFEGEILMWAPNLNKDILLTRIPTGEIETGLILRPGFKLDYTDKRCKVDHEWEQNVKKHGITDERGLYLPLYEIATVEKFCFNRIKEAEKAVQSYLMEEKKALARVLMQQ